MELQMFLFLTPFDDWFFSKTDNCNKNIEDYKDYKNIDTTQRSSLHNLSLYQRQMIVYFTNNYFMTKQHNNWYFT